MGNRRFDGQQDYNPLIVAAPLAIARSARFTYKEHIRIISGRLTRRTSIKVPLLQVFDALGQLVEGHGLATQAVRAVDPDVFRLDFTILREAHVGCQKVFALGGNEAGHCRK